MKPIIAITVGDFNGVGPEVTLKSLLHPSVRRQCVPLLVGPRSVFEFYARRMKLPFTFDLVGSGRRTDKKTVHVYETSDVSPPRIKPGDLSAEAGDAAARSIVQSVRLVQTGRAAAVVTAPVSKQALHLAGVNFPGQTEMIQSLTGSRHVAMMLVCPELRIGLITIHVPIHRVARTLTPQLLQDRIKVIHDALVHDWNIAKPRVALLGLNPHAGEGGDIGTEEQRILIPTIVRLRRRGMTLDGPFPADGFFAYYRRNAYDAVIALYHDQGLIPIKMLSAGKAVNVSVGLNIVRTSPDHGTAFPLAGQGVASAESMVEAIRLAVNLAKRRTRQGRS
jgi:4-hydroxythreonine-4-phosphate dehydrogenase